MRRPVTTGSCVTGCLGGEPHVLSMFGRGKVKSRMDVAQPLRATTCWAGGTGGNLLDRRDSLLDMLG